MPEVPGEVVVFRETRGRWLLRNVMARTAIAVESDALALLREAEAGEGPREGEYRAWEVGRFSNYDGLLADPTGYIREVADWPDPERYTAQELAERFRALYLLVDDAAAYRERMAPKSSLLDGAHFGNFHQQLGEELLLRRREKPEDWWVAQKFTDDLTGVRDNLYGAVQMHFLRSWIPERVGPGTRVVDLGSGTGFYSSLFAEAGADVLGVDPTEGYVELARRGAPANARFERMDIPGGLDAIPDGSADLVFMSDALLFYFVSPDGGATPDIAQLLSAIRRILAPGGRYVSVEPHYTFWLAPWHGDPELPFTVLTEHRSKWFGVTPSTAELVQAWTGNGFAIVDMRELPPDPAFEAVDPRAFHFARQFPLWQVFELEPRAD